MPLLLSTGPGGDSEHGVVDGDWRSKRMWGSLESRNAYIYAQSLNAWNAYIKGLREYMASWICPYPK